MGRCGRVCKPWRTSTSLPPGLNPPQRASCGRYEWCGECEKVWEDVEGATPLKPSTSLVQLHLPTLKWLIVSCMTATPSMLAHPTALPARLQAIQGARSSCAIDLQLLSFTSVLSTRAHPTVLAHLLASRQSKAPAAAAPSFSQLTTWRRRKASVTGWECLWEDGCAASAALRCGSVGLVQGMRSVTACLMEGLCDRLGVFVGGRQRCVGSPGGMNIASVCA